MHLSRSWLISFFVFLFLNVHIAACSAASNYDERLHLKSFPGSSLLASFYFQTTAKQSAFNAQHFGLFPRSLGQILQHTHTKELHLRFNAGRWDTELWEERPWNGTREGGTGVELWAWVEAQDDQEADAHWLMLTNALSGLFCASLNFVDSTRTTRPVMTFEPQGHHNMSATATDLHLLHGALPREVVCTENLTPFVKLLPCKGKAGISSLLDGHKLFDASWQSMAIDIRPAVDPETNEILIEMVQTIDMVVSIERSKRPRDDPIPRPLSLDSITCDTSKYYHGYGDTCFPVPSPQLPFTLEEIFGRPLKGSCSLSGELLESSASLCIDIEKGREAEVVTSGKHVQTQIDDSVRCYQIQAEIDFDLRVERHQQASEALQYHLQVERVLTGKGQERGGLATVFINPTMQTMNFVYFESLPWFAKLYLHTFTANIRSISIFSSISQAFDPIQQMYYQPAVDRSRPTHLELLIEMPPSSQLTIKYDIEKSILRYAEYPPDANRGFDIAPGVVRVLPNSDNQDSEGYSHYLRTTSLLLYLPTPDFSMPYNTIILTSTVIALGFGTIFNILVRRFVSVDEAEALAQGSLKERLRQRIMALRTKFIEKGKIE